MQMHDNVYDLILSPDINTAGYLQWFFFSVERMHAKQPYTFNIINMEKSGSQFLTGMQPVMFSRSESRSESKQAPSQGAAQRACSGWRRAGTHIQYYKTPVPCQGRSALYSFYSILSFTITFPYADDLCYLAYHFPFTFTCLQRHLASLERLSHTSQCLIRQQLTRTIGGNACELLTISSFSTEDVARYPPHDRVYIVLSSRVHPGESNASWVMKGLLDFLVSSHDIAAELRRRCVFKIIPMLNPDGVINGSLRCSLAACDLNRRWFGATRIYFLLFRYMYHTWSCSSPISLISLSIYRFVTIIVVA
jgi:hypothetical protein